MNAVRERKLSLSGEVLHFTPFEPASKRSEALVHLTGGGTQLVMKGAPLTIAALCTLNKEIEPDMQHLASTAYRVLAVASGAQDGPLYLAGLLALQDAPRSDSKSMIQSLNELGVRVLMITGDDLLTAQAIARQVGITGCSLFGGCTASAGSA